MFGKGGLYMIKVKVTIHKIMTGEPYNVFHKNFQTIEQANKYIAIMKIYGITAEIVEQ